MINGRPIRSASSEVIGYPKSLVHSPVKHRKDVNIDTGKFRKWCVSSSSSASGLLPMVIVAKPEITYSTDSSKVNARISVRMPATKPLTMSRRSFMNFRRKTFTMRTRRIRRQNRSREVPKMSLRRWRTSCTTTSVTPVTTKTTSNQFQILSSPHQKMPHPSRCMRRRVSITRKEEKVISKYIQPPHSSKTGSVWKPIITPLRTMRIATKGSTYINGCSGSGGAAKSLIRTKVNSATRRLVSPASKISRMAWNCLKICGPKIFRWISPSCERNSSIKAEAGTTL
mmetsp:Transcript_119175/g.282831  ORF Transcript_119175/g.282831 Transcript_119175/m.282831 type:complete len:284 (+) Transcript_119175:788-1639(+)